MKDLFLTTIFIAFINPKLVKLPSLKLHLSKGSILTQKTDATVLKIPENINNIFRVFVVGFISDAVIIKVIKAINWDTALTLLRTLPLSELLNTTPINVVNDNPAIPTKTALNVTRAVKVKGF